MSVQGRGLWPLTTFESFLAVPASPWRSGVGAPAEYAHIGILKVLEEHGHDIVSIAGSSVGALVGGLYAAYDSLNDFSAWVRGLKHRVVAAPVRPVSAGPRAIPGRRSSPG